MKPWRYRTWRFEHFFEAALLLLLLVELRWENYILPAVRGWIGFRAGIGLGLENIKIRRRPRVDYEIGFGLDYNTVLYSTPRSI